MMTTFVYLLGSYKCDGSISDVLLLLVHYHNLINHTHDYYKFILTINVGELVHLTMMYFNIEITKHEL